MGSVQSGGSEGSNWTVQKDLLLKVFVSVSLKPKFDGPKGSNLTVKLRF